MAKRVTKRRTLVKLSYPVKVELRETVIKPLKSIPHLDLDRLSKTAKAEIELGHIEVGCCSQLVSAIVRKGLVTKLVIEPCPEASQQKATPELAQLLKLAHKKAKAAGIGPVKNLPMPVGTFFRDLARSIKTLWCFEICLFGRCIACCVRTDTANFDWFCGRITIDTTSGPYPE